MKVTKRLEYKYFITYIDYFKIIETLRSTMIHDQHGTKESYPVISVYLDDLVFNGASDKAFGNQIHKKYRIRHYHDVSNKKLELKHKVGDVSTKYSEPINDEIYHAIINQDLDVLHNHFDKDLVRRFTLDMLKHHLEPKCYIKYKREAFRDELDNVRITFDHSLCVERFQQEVQGMDLKLMKDAHLILEIKYEKYMPSLLKDLLNKITLNQTAYSKYFMGFNGLEL